MTMCSLPIGGSSTTRNWPFSERTYTMLMAHEQLMPERTRVMLPYMVKGDWLNTYASLEGLGRALAGLARRVPEGASMVGAEKVLADHFVCVRNGIP